MRMYVGDKKYKQVSLNVLDKAAATQLALEHWRTIQNQLDAGEIVYNRTVQQLLDDYHNHLDSMVETNQYKIHTVNGKRTSLKKLRLILQPYENKGSAEIPKKILADYVTWRRSKNWDKNKRKRTTTPPSDATVNKELTDFKDSLIITRSEVWSIPGSRLTGRCLRRTILVLMLMIGGI